MTNPEIEQGNDTAPARRAATHVAVLPGGDGSKNIIGFGIALPKSIKIYMKIIPLNGVFDIVLRDESTIVDFDEVPPAWHAKRPPDAQEIEIADATGRKAYWLEIGKAEYLDGTSYRMRVTLTAMPREFIISLSPPMPLGGETPAPEGK
jgi:hypothetical protein